MTDMLYRIIDANFNRAREAFRVMEEYCRFGLNNEILSKKVKSCRHLLCEKLKAIDPLLLLSNRDVPGDVGKDLSIQNQQQRTSLEDCFTAASKRAGEALRALAEVTMISDPDITMTMEKLRFEVYEIERMALLLSDSRHKFLSVRLYILISVTTQTNISELIELTQICIENGADCIQLRAKGLNDAQLLNTAKELTALCKGTDTLSIINDRVDIAILSEADGVHLGQEDISVSCARKLARRPIIIGLSTHNLGELDNAIESQCDYVSLGPVFSSPTKPSLKVAGPDYLQKAISILDKTGLSHVAIGGINIENINSVLQAGARAVAVGSAVTHAKNPVIICKTFKERLLAFEN